MSELVVDLTNPESVELARRVLEALGNDWPAVPTTSGANASRNGGEAGGSASASADQTPPWEGPDEIDRTSRGPESDSKADDADPWATSAQSTETPRAATSAPSTGTVDDDDDPWS